MPNATTNRASALHRASGAPLSRAANGQGTHMTKFDDRERAFETKFAHDEEMQFRIIARRNRLLGEWAARQMGLSEAEAESYAKDVVRSDFEEAGEHDVIRKVLGDLTPPASMRRGQIREALATRRSRRGARSSKHEPDADAVQRDRAADQGRSRRRGQIRDLAGDGDHYAARVVSRSFAGLSRIKQHQASMRRLADA